MRAFFINLADAAERRAALVWGFAAHRCASWELARVEAVTAAEAEAAAVPGRISWREKACFLSHRRAVETSLAEDGPSWIMEDDVAFGAHSFPLVEHGIGARKGADWDILFTDFGVGHTGQMLRFMDMGQRLHAARKAVAMDLRRVHFTGAMSYIVAAEAKPKLHALLAEAEVLDQAYDTFLRMAVRSGRLRAVGLFPFATTFHSLAMQSQVRDASDSEADSLIRAFRRALWFERDLNASLPELEARIGDNPEARAYGALLGALLFARGK